MSVSDDSSVTLVKRLPTSFLCFTLSPVDADTFMISTINHERPVRTIDVHGNEGDFKHKLLPDKTYKTDESTCTYIPSTNTCVFVERDQHTVYMCDITSGEGHVVTSDKIVTPRRVHAGPNDTVFVCSRGTHAIVQISPRGDILISHNVDMKFPYAVSLSRDGTRLAVSNSEIDNFKIKLFKVSS